MQTTNIEGVHNLFLYKLYFFLISIFFGYVFIQQAIDPENWLNGLDWLDSILSIFSLIGLFGYLYNKKIGQPLFWKVFSYLFLIWNIAYSVYIVLTSPEIRISTGLEATVAIILLLIIYALHIPLMIGLFKYSYSKRGCNNP